MTKTEYYATTCLIKLPRMMDGMQTPAHIQSVRLALVEEEKEVKKYEMQIHHNEYHKIMTIQKNECRLENTHGPQNISRISVIAVVSAINL